MVTWITYQRYKGIYQVHEQRHSQTSLIKDRTLVPLVVDYPGVYRKVSGPVVYGRFPVQHVFQFSKDVATKLFTASFSI